MKTIGDELSVSTLLEGGVQRAGDRIRINVQPIDADTDEHLWADNYNRELTTENIFEIQEDIARMIAEALHAVLSPAELAKVREMEQAGQLARTPNELDGIRFDLSL